MNATQIFQFIMVAGGSAGVATLINAILSRRKIIAESHKIGVDSAQVLSAASVALLEPMERQIGVLDSQLNRSQARADHLDTRLRETTRDLHSATDQLRDCTKMVEELTAQLTYYREKYGPPTGELPIVRTTR